MELSKPLSLNGTLEDYDSGDFPEVFNSYTHPGNSSCTYADSLSCVRMSPGFAVILVVIMIGAILVIIGIIKERNSRFSYCVDNCVCCCCNTRPPSSTAAHQSPEDPLPPPYFQHQSRYGVRDPALTVTHQPVYTFSRQVLPERVEPPAKLFYDEPPPPYESLQLSPEVQVHSS